ncbi:class I SAM-dependent methyltransferase [Paenibacillus arenilitoris]|uniref:Methyltransferase domain-containing protein n=1 Tax=Paenibacillus arenilitoris TaxID=2772299 RepID=A0A927CNH1_9BACL|nr:class I SAM-dependent methyltransferase [Paenibacillus arenilitoris]MBD2870645.1 methyltransferase domain-containing protein [Paenibacillus arenilitoris]
MALYDVIGIEYDTSRKADSEITRRLMNHLQVFDDSKIVDVACGTGNYTVALSELGLNMTGTDISEEMLNKARSKSNHVVWDQADVIDLPYTNGEFYGATCILAIHHFKDLLNAFQQVHRVLDKGRFVIFTSSPDQMERYWLKEYFPKTMIDSCNQMPRVSDVVDYLKRAGFKIEGLETFLIQPSLQDFFLYSGKHEPNMYLNPKVRSGISTFANLASKEEISVGCTRLKSDIESGRIHDILDRYSSDLGDYLFVVADKR